MERRGERCITCSRSVLQDRNRHVVTRDYMEPRPGFTDYVMERINLNEAILNEIQFMCYRCWVAANRREARHVQEVRQNEEVQGEHVSDEHPTSVPTYRRLANTSRRCLYHGCRNEDRHRIPNFLKVFLLTEYNLYVPQDARICADHMQSNDWGELFDFAEMIFTPEQIKDVFDTIRDAYRNNSGIDFENIQTISSQELYFRTGVTHEQFEILLTETPSLMKQTKRPKIVLGAYLMKIRSGEPDIRIACLLNMSRWTLERYLKIARDCLSRDFVVRHLGLDHISRDEIIEHSLTVPTALFGQAVDPKAIVLCDGTYIYIQKSKNFMFQKKTYSLHKYKNLMKPFLLVCPGGYIIDILGPYGATTSDAQIMIQLMEDESPLHGLLHANDVFILDRGFRDSIPRIETCGYEPHMPPTKSRQASQLTNRKANESRKITIVRWVIEVINGWFKRDFKIFRNQLFNKSLPHLMTDFRITGALLNAFKNRLHDNTHATAFIDIINRRMNSDNTLGKYVVEQNMNRQRASFVTLTDESINVHFPVLDDEDIILFSLGTYHLKLARSYVSEHIRKGVYNIEVCVSPSPRMSDYGLLTENATLMRGRVLSRHISNKIYYTYILINENVEGITAIQAYYCSCLTGMRTIGACAHVVSIIWYFGIGRHLEHFVGPASAWDVLIIDSENTQ